MRVQVIQRKGHAALVQWVAQDGALRRATVPVQAVTGDEADEADLEMGIGYGVPWEELLRGPQVTAARVGEMLRLYGIWTKADLRARPNVALAALQAAYAIDLAALMQAAERYEKERSDVR